MINHAFGFSFKNCWLNPNQAPTKSAPDLMNERSKSANQNAFDFSIDSSQKSRHLFQNVPPSISKTSVSEGQVSMDQDSQYVDQTNSDVFNQNITESFCLLSPDRYKERIIPHGKHEAVNVSFQVLIKPGSVCDSLNQIFSSRDDVSNSQQNIHCLDGKLSFGHKTLIQLYTSGPLSVYTSFWKLCLLRKNFSPAIASAKATLSIAEIRKFSDDFQVLRALSNFSDSSTHQEKILCAVSALAAEEDRLHRINLINCPQERAGVSTQ